MYKAKTCKTRTEVLLVNTEQNQTNGKYVNFGTMTAIQLLIFAAALKIV